MMKRMISASRVEGSVTARKVLRDLRQLYADLEDLADADPDTFEELDLRNVTDEVEYAVRFVANSLLEGM